LDSSWKSLKITVINFGVHGRDAISSAGERLSASEEGLCFFDIIAGYPVIHSVNLPRENVKSLKRKQLK
jgi:hypothetical protein